MLILTRKIREAIRINDDVTITVVGVTKSSVSLSITAPRTMAIHRKEIYKRIKSKIKISTDVKETETETEAEF